MVGRISDTSRPLQRPAAAAQGSIVPDLYVTFPAKQFMLDVSVVYPACATYHKGAAEAPLYAAQKREDTEITKYGTLASHNRYKFVPFVMESTGALGKRAAAFLKDLAQYAREHL